ncbi:hypothetical protein L0128_04420 [candidate division KSB1 bacterium]|nr:hypothetical protein [candidate division KSB1 bacterium]
MEFFVIDTNVAIVANNKAPQAGPDCVLRCIDILEKIIRTEGVTLDDLMLILREYMHHLNPKGQPGPGDAFLKWIWQNQGNPHRCEQAKITLIDEVSQAFAEFPADPHLIHFDRNDRKFVAAARASKKQPAILNAVDSDWWEFRLALAAAGVKVDFVCPNQFKNE